MGEKKLARRAALAARWACLVLLAGVIWVAQARPGEAADTTPLCRAGVGASQQIGQYPITNMRFGWYADWTATQNPARPGGIEYMPMVRFTATGPNSYSAYPTGQKLIDIAKNNPGALWIVGNEPDRKLFQDGLEPHIYARGYHDLYYQIKAADPTARVAAGSIVQPTPLRLQYLDMVLSSYRSQFNASLPVDVWNMHAFILREMSCDHDPNSCWGADVPPGINAPYGMLYEIDDNDNFEIFKQFIVDFRQWMQARGYQNKPLIITEFGILMPADYGFDAARVNAFMNKTLEHLGSASGPTGYPFDGNRYVQQFAWYSLDDFMFNGPLFDSASRQPTVFGQNFAAFAAKVPSQINLQPVFVSVKQPSQGNAARLETGFVNNGNVRLAAPVKVRVYDGNPAAGGKPIAPDAQINSIEGCASVVTRVVSAPQSELPGPTTAWVVIDPDNQIAETNEADNTIRVTLLNPSQRVLLPNVLLRN